MCIANRILTLDLILESSLCGRASDRSPVELLLLSPITAVLDIQSIPQESIFIPLRSTSITSNLEISS